jgi:hypothetical protein
MNWHLMKNHIKGKGLIVSREAVYALLLTIMAILAGCLFVLAFIH